MNGCGRILNQEDALKFMLGGKSEFVLHSTKTNEDFKYYVTRKDSSINNLDYVYFVSIMDGNSKTYAGHVWYDKDKNSFFFSQGNKGNVSEKNLHIRSLIFVLNKMMRGEHVGNLEVFHVGRCGRCGKKLTTPESILTGLGPTCSKNLGIPRVKIN